MSGHKHLWGNYGLRWRLPDEFLDRAALEEGEALQIVGRLQEPCLGRRLVEHAQGVQFHHLGPVGCDVGVFGGKLVCSQQHLTIRPFDP